MIIMLLGWWGRFMESRLAQIAMAVAAVLLIVVWFYNWASNNGKRGVELEVQTVTIEEMERQKEVIRKVLRTVQERASKSIERNQELEGQINDLVKVAKQKPTANNVCISPDITKRLRSLK